MTYDNKILNELKKFPMYVVVKSRVPELSHDGAEWVAKCPFHKDDTPSFKVFKKDGVWLGHCFGCQITYNAAQFVQFFDKVSFGDAVEKVKKEFEWYEGKEVVESTFAQPMSSEKKIVTFPLSVQERAEQALAETPEAQEWLASRGIALDTAQTLHWGFVQSVRSISPQHPWVDRGWISMPYIDGDKITLLKLRSIIGKKTEDGKKSGILRAPDMVTTLYNLGSITPMDDAFLVEGEPDAAIFTQAGYSVAAFPSNGYTPTPAERDVLVRANRLFLAGDMDDVGRAAMKKLWGEFRDRVYLIEWPNGCKDANETFLKVCAGDTIRFQSLIEDLKSKALERPIPDFYDVRESLRNADSTNPMDNPRRLHMRDPKVDAMAVTLPGNVVSVFATYTGTGKTTWCLDGFELEEAMKHGSVVINYSAELSPSEYARLVASNLLQKDRLNLSKEDFNIAAQMLDAADAKFYVGYNPDLNRIGPVLDCVEWAIRRLGAHIVVLDHLHFLTRGERDDIKAQADAMQRIKNIAVKYQVIFVVVGQSRKEQPNRKGRPSEASDAKGSESFISDASTTYHIHRGVKRDIDLEKPETWPDDILDNIADIRLYKCRTKGPGKAVARQSFDGKCGRFYPYTTQERP